MQPCFHIWHVAFIAFWAIPTALAQNDTEKLPGFNQSIDILGAMERTDQDFQDGLALDLFSPKNRTLVVQQNASPLPGNLVTGTSGEPFIALMNYSYIIKMNETANDLIAKIEIPYDPDALAKMGIQESNTYVGTLAKDKISWVIDETTRNVHRSENNTRIIKMTSLDGEYMLLARATADTSNIFVQYGQGATRTVNITGGGRQEAEFIDGLRLSVVAPRGKNIAMNIDIKNGVDPATLPTGMTSLNTYSWVVNTSDPTANISVSMKVPFNRAILAGVKAGATAASPAMLQVAKRNLNGPATSKFQVVDLKMQAIDASPVDRIAVRDVAKVDGEYVLLVNPQAAAAGKSQEESEEMDAINAMDADRR